MNCKKERFHCSLILACGLGLILIFGGCSTTEETVSTPQATVVAGPTVAVSTPSLSGVWEKPYGQGDTESKIQFAFVGDTLIGIGLSNRSYGGILGMALMSYNISSPGRVVCTVKRFKDIPDDPPIGHTFSFSYVINEDGTMTTSRVYDAPDYLAGTWKKID